jgi:hypothetical protein
LTCEPRSPGFCLYIAASASLIMSWGFW